MNTGLTLPLAFLTGVLGALHCLGMCSGLAGGYFVRYGQGVGAVLIYHATRILLYGGLGMASAFGGRVLVQQGRFGKGQGLLMMAAGLAIIVIGLTRWWPLPGSRNQRHRTSTVVTKCPEPGCSVCRTRPNHLFAALAGALNGLVPCSLTASIAIAGTATADPLRAALLMMVFGLGTLPVMALVSLAGTAIARSAHGLYASLAGVVVVMLGLWTLYEGWVFYDIMCGLGN